jgi:hypothetical protein
VQSFKGSLLIITALLASGCGAPKSDKDEPEKRKGPVPTVFDPLVQQRQQLPARAEAALRQHDADIHRQGDDDAAPPGEPPR